MAIGPGQSPDISGDTVIFYSPDQQWITFLNLVTGAQGATHYQAYNHDPRIDGEWFVWCTHGRDYRYNALYVSNLARTIQKEVISYPQGSGSRDISGNWIVYTKDSNVYLYNIVTDERRQVTKKVAERPDAAISGELVVWTEGTSEGWGLSIYDISTLTEEPRQITSSKGRMGSVALSGSQIVWEDQRNGDWDVYSYDISTMSETRITSNPHNQMHPGISGNRIVWMDDRNGNWDIFQYDLSTGTELATVTGSGSQTLPAINGDWIVWQDNRNGGWKIYTQRVDGIPEIPWITLDPIPNNIINGDQVTLMARTSLPTGTEVIMDVVSKPAPIGSTTAQEFAGTAGVVQVTQNTGSANTTSFSFNTEHFITEVSNPNTYLVTAESPVFNIRCLTEFRLLASKPIANFTAYPTAGFAPLNVTFIETSTRSPSSWLWNFGDGSLSTEESPLHTYRNPGVYAVSLTAINQMGQNMVMKRDLISVYPDTFSTTADTYISSATVPTAGPNRRITSPRQINYGSEPLLSIVRGNRSRNIYLNWQGALIRVDLPPIPVDLVESATLNIYHGNPYREEIAFHRMLTGWKEMEVTYDRPNAGAALWASGWMPGGNFAMEPTAKVPITQTGRWYTIDVTADVKAFLSGTAQNHGWFLKSGETIGDDGASTAFVSTEGRVGQRPYLSIKQVTNTQRQGTILNYDSLSSPNGNLIGWATTTHKQIMGTTSLKAGVPPEWAQVITEFSDDPDFWRYSGDENLNRILKAREHYWNPEIEKLEIIPLIGLLVGAAPSNCEKYSTLAKSDANNNNLDKYVNLGLASHFMIDIGNPMHTGKTFETLEDNSNTHDNYEIYVGLNWTTGAMLSRAISNDYYWNSVNDPARTTKSLARYSNGYLNSLYDTVRNNPTTFSMNTTEKGMLVEEITLNCLRATGRNSWGLIQFVA